MTEKECGLETEVGSVAGGTESETTITLRVSPTGTLGGEHYCRFQEVGVEDGT